MVSDLPTALIRISKRENWVVGPQELVAEQK